MRSSQDRKRRISSLKQINKNDSGFFSLLSVTVFFVLLLLFLGLIELTRLYYTRMTLQQATDAAALAARALYQNSSQTPSFNELSLEASRYFNLNCSSSYIPLLTQGPTLEVAADFSSFTVAATLAIQPLVLFVFNQPSFSLTVQSTYPLP